SATGKGAQVAARRIAMIHLLIGPVRAVDAATGRVEILGQAVLAQTPADAAGITSGDWVQVSGYRLSSGEVKASRIERLAPQPQATRCWFAGSGTEAACTRNSSTSNRRDKAWGGSTTSSSKDTCAPCREACWAWATT